MSQRATTPAGREAARAGNATIVELSFLRRIGAYLWIGLTRPAPPPVPRANPPRSP